MSRHRESARLVGTGLLAATTTWVALWAWSSFLTTPDSYLQPLLVMALAIAIAGAALRAARVPAPLTLLAQAVLAVALLCRQYAGSLLPTQENLAAVSDAVGAALGSARQYAAPIGSDVPSVAPLLVVAGLALILLVDVLACGLRRVPLAGLALLAIYSVPAGIPTDNSTWLSFVVAAAGFLALLHLETRQQMRQWGRPLGPREGSSDVALNPVSEALRAGAGRIGVTVTALALVAPLLVPVLDLDLFGLGPGGGSDDIRIRKPIADMRRDLQRPEDRPLLRIVTDDPSPDYLRVAVLNRYTGNEWSSGDRDVDPSDRADGELPPPRGLASDAPRRTRDYDVQVFEDFDATWLPTQFPAASVTAGGDWRFDPDSMDFLATGEENTAGLSYEMTGLEVDFGNDASRFRDSSSSAVESEFRELPDTLPSSVTRWAEQVTDGATSDYEHATRLQAWFRSSEFTYSLERAPVGTGNQTLAGFLTPGGRVGYCEQFASAMAVMARVLGIPARVAVGFLRPERQPDGSWIYSSHDLHAWPELYFNGAGWVRFEPTPAARAATVPPYSVAADDRDQPGQNPTNQPSAEPTGPTPGAADPTQVPTTDPGAEENASGDTGASGATRVGLAVLIGLVLLGLALLAPRALRGRQREHRLHGGPDSVWDELHASALDLGLPWPERRSPREVRAVLAEHTTDAAAISALDRIVAAVEAGRYGRPGRAGPTPGALAEDARACLTVWEDAAPPRARRRARWRPRSLTRLRVEPSTSLREPSRL